MTFCVKGFGLDGFNESKFVGEAENLESLELS
jgi:hypothetical protein